MPSLGKFQMGSDPVDMAVDMVFKGGAYGRGDPVREGERNGKEMG
jgi:hypothetical protein